MVVPHVYVARGRWGSGEVGRSLGVWTLEERESGDLCDPEEGRAQPRALQRSLGGNDLRSRRGERVMRLM